MLSESAAASTEVPVLLLHAALPGRQAIHFLEALARFCFEFLLAVNYSPSHFNLTEPASLALAVAHSYNRFSYRLR